MRLRLRASAIVLSLSLAALMGCHHAGAADKGSEASLARLYDLEGMRLVVHIANALYPTKAFEPRDGQQEAAALSRRISRLVSVGGRDEIANRAWFAQTLSPSAPALEFATHTFDLETSSIDFASFSAQRDIRGWLGSNAPAVPISSGTGYIIASHAAFSDPWAVGFDPRLTMKRPFFGSRGITYPEFLMNDLLKIRYERSTEGIHVLVPLRGEMGLWLYQPVNSALLTRPLTAWIDSTYRPAFEAMSVRKANLSFPRFSAGDSGGGNLLPLLRSLRKEYALGMPQLRASLPPDALVQSSMVDVNEHGVSASSVTILHRYLTSVKTTTVTIDHPFAFAIVDDKDKHILFTGAITDI